MKTKILKPLTSIAIVIAFLMSVPTHAQTKKEERTLGNFKRITVGGIFKLKLEKGESPKVIIEADEEIMDKIITEVNGETLEIKLSGGKYKGDLDITEITVVFTNLEEIIASGAAEVESESEIVADNLKIDFSGATKGELIVNAGKLETELSGATNMELSGKATEHTAKISGASNFDAENLETQNTTIDLSGASNAEIDVVNKLNGNISGMGKLELKRKPAESNISASGLGEAFVEDSLHNSGVKITMDPAIRDGLISIGEDKDDDKFDGHWGGFELGTSWYMSSSGSFDSPEHNKYLELNHGKSLSANINLWEKNFNLANNKFGLITGLGFSFRNYKFDETRTLLGNDRDTLYGFIDSNYLNKNADKSKLNVAFLTLPVLFEYQVPLGKRKVYVGAGGIGGLKIGSHTKIVYSEGNNETTKKDHKSFHLNPFYYGARAYLGYAGVNIFADYGLSELFQKDEGPQVYPFSIGIRIVGW